MGDGAEEVDPVGDAGRGGLGAEAVEQLAAAGDDEMDRSSPTWASASIATSRRLKWWARSRVATNAATIASAADPEPVAHPRFVGAGREQLGVDAVRHLDQLLRGPPQIRDRAGVVGRKHADPVGRADQSRGDAVLVGGEQGSTMPGPTSRFL